MIMKNTILRKVQYRIGGVVLCILAASCMDMSEINSPRYDASNEDMTHDNFKAGASYRQLQDWVVPTQENAFQNCENMVGDEYGRYLNYTKSAWNDAYYVYYNAPDKWYGWMFDNVFPKIYTAWNEIKGITNGQGVNFAWAQLLRIAAMQRVTDTYGPIPYSKVVNNELQVAYDSQEDVYKNMFVDLTEARDLLYTYATANPGATPMDDFDKVYNGGFENWIKFANSLKLRMALRIRFANPSLAQEMAEEAVNHPGGLITVNAENATVAPPEGKSPLYVMWKTYNDTRVSADIASYMAGYNDPRQAAYFQQATIAGTTGYLGKRVGIKNLNEAWGAAYSAPVANPDDRVIWLTASEVAFCRAEGAMLGWNMGGNAEQFYNEGIRLSFEQWGVSGYDTYANDETSKPGNYKDPNNKGTINAQSTITIKWQEGDSQEKKLERIITQKWIALWPLGQEAWSEHRRTGYPKFFPLGSATDPNIEVASRLPYSINEVKNNSNNLTEAIRLLGGEDNYETRVWWDTK
jgi:hypothetical protein